MVQQLQQEMGVEMDTLVTGVKQFIKDYGKEKGYAYIYGTGENVSILYAEDKFDITKEMIKLLNDKYKAAPKTDNKAEAKKRNRSIKEKEVIASIVLKNLQFLSIEGFFIPIL